MDKGWTLTNNPKHILAPKKSLEKSLKVSLPYIVGLEIFPESGAIWIIKEDNMNVHWRCALWIGAYKTWWDFGSLGSIELLSLAHKMSGLRYPSCVSWWTISSSGFSPSIIHRCTMMRAYKPWTMGEMWVRVPLSLHGIWSNWEDA